MFAVEAGIHKDVVAVAADEPDHHGDVEFAVFIGSCDQAADAEIGDGGVFDGEDSVLGLGLGEGSRS